MIYPTPQVFSQVVPEPEQSVEGGLYGSCLLNKWPGESLWFASAGHKVARRTKVVSRMPLVEDIFWESEE